MSAPPKPALQASGLGHRYGDRWVFRGLHLLVEHPASAAIMGPSGVGKTTLLSILGGLLAPREGRVALDGEERPAPKTRLVSWVFQTSNAFANRSVLDNVADPLRLFGIGTEEARCRAEEALHAVGIAPRRHDRARRLSGGELQRLGVARALAAGRPFILADEPSGQLDEHSTANVVDALVNRRPARTTVLIVTHDERRAPMRASLPPVGCRPCPLWLINRTAPSMRCRESPRAAALVAWPARHSRTWRPAGPAPCC